MSSERWTRERDRALVVTGLVGVILLAWMLLVPQGAQPDEASHLVRSAAVVRFADGDGVYLLPDRFRVAEPACYAFDPVQPVTCSEVPVHTDGEVPLPTRADDYPPGAHLVFGLAGSLPGLDPVWWARLAATIASTLLVGGSLALARRRSPLTAAALLLGLTPMAWSIMTAVNPSAFATAGAAALWIGLLLLADRDREHDPRDRDAAAWLLTSGWVALVLARRDGLVWACLAVALVCMTAGRTPLRLARQLGTRRLVPIGLATLVALAWGVTSSASSSRWIVAAPLALVAAEVVARVWPRLGRDERRAAGLAIGVVGAVAWPLAIALRPGGWDTNLLLTLVAQTDENLIEAVGVLGWLDTPVPGLLVDGWLVAVGVLVAIAVLTRSWRPAAVLAGVTVLASWTLELLQGNTSGTYWQGRYSLPLLLAVPLLLVRRAGDLGHRLTERLVAPITVTALSFVNVAAWAAARRFGVGHAGSHLPWRWDTPLQPVPPFLLLIVMAAASIGLVAVIVRPSDQPR